LRSAYSVTRSAHDDLERVGVQRFHVLFPGAVIDQVESCLTYINRLEDDALFCIRP
jgi:hypothetical protein